jgi:hypothetical protein
MIDHKRLAYLEGLCAHIEGSLPAPPDIGQPLAKEWLRGWHHGEEWRDELEAPLQDEIDDLEAQIELQEAQIESQNADPAAD